ncbi:hypothetical protein GCM10018962_89530 [Dactylosporangium matsuzakiense]|uniref:Uncharacterized protein n=2 Tax=Dactylosporangium TaxID=35753 RepID=A0A9W6KGT9_9ACTN|nr:hypothetical protein GCM10017581_029940 [Dactylosporangium matsuzakiense]
MRMTSEPPPGYVAFVSRHLEPLRRDSSRVVGGDEDADYLYVDVLTDVATRWPWLELQRTRLGQDGAADDYLDRTFHRRSERYYAAEDAEHIEDDRQITVTPEGAGQRRAVQRYVSTAVRLAPIVVPRRKAFIAGPAAEAAIAWWHAYENIRRRRLVYIGFVVLLLLLGLAQFSGPAEM